MFSFDGVLLFKYLNNDSKSSDFNSVDQHIVALFFRDPKDPVETRERLARQERGDRRVTVGSPVCRVCLDLP